MRGEYGVAVDALSAGSLVGRDRQLDDLSRRLESGAGAVVTGAPGSGVSALLIALVQAERARGRHVVHRLAVTDRSPLRGVEDHDVVVVDDAHLLSVESAAEVRELLLAGSVKVVLGSTGRPLVEPLGWLWRSGLLARIEVPALGADEVAELIERAAGAPPDRPTVDAFVADSGGLPAFLVDPLAAAVADGSLSTSAGLVRLAGPLPDPAGLRDRWGALALTLDADEREVLDLVCVAGQLDAGTAREILQPAAAFDELERRGVLVRVRSLDRWVVRAAAGAIRRSVRRALGPAEVARRAERLLPALDAHAGSGAPAGRPGRSEPSELAVAAALAGQIDRVADAAAAVRTLMDEQRLDEAEQLASVAAEAGDHRSALMLAKLLSERGDRQGAADRLERLLSEPELDLFVQFGAAAELATLRLWDLGDADGAIRLVRSMEEASGGADGPARPAHLTVLAFAGHVGEVLELADERPDQLLNGTEMLYQGTSVAFALGGRADQGVELARRGLDLCLASDAANRELDSEIHVLSLALALTEAGHLAEAESLSTRHYEAAVGRAANLAWMAIARARVALARGDLVGLDRFGAEAAGIFVARNNAGPLRWAVAGRLFSAALRADLPSVQLHLAELDALDESGVRFLEPDVSRARAWALAVLGDGLGARRELADAATEAESLGNVALAANVWHTAFRLGDRDRSVGQIERLGAALANPWGDLLVAHAAATAAGDHDALLSVAAAFHMQGRDLEARETAAQVVGAALRSGDRAGVRAARRAESELSLLAPGAVTPMLALAPAPQLTAREREVSLLAAGSATSQAIAAELGISVRTVDNLLSRSYLKLGVSSRDELGDAMRREYVGEHS